MYIKHVKIDNFRNIAAADMELNPQFNILVGANGQGKTNTIEGIYLTLTGKSHRENVIDNFISNGYQQADTEIHVIYDDQTQYNVKMNLAAEKTYTIDEETVKKRVELTRNFALIFFSPDDLRLIKEGPAERRVFINDAIQSVAPKYAAALGAYTKVLKQKNTVLKEYAPSAKSLLDVYDEHLISYGSTVIKYRILFLKEFEKKLSSLYSQISGGNEQLSLSYISNIFEQGAKPDIEAQYKKVLTESRETDLRTGFSSIGPHHDDINILLNKMSARKFASQGQQRSIALCMKLALIDIYYEKNKEKPIVLLDDVMSELDDRRQEMILKMLDGVQTFITCVNSDFIECQKDATVFTVVNGTVKKRIERQKTER